MHDFAGVDLTFGTFPELARLCRDDPSFPATQRDWDALVARDTAALLHDGDAPPDIPLDPERFEHWCQAFVLPPCMDALRAYCIIHRQPPGHHRYGATPLDSEVGALDP